MNVSVNKILEDVAKMTSTFSSRSIDKKTRKQSISGICSLIRRNSGKLEEYFKTTKTANVFSYGDFMLKTPNRSSSINYSEDCCQKCGSISFVQTIGQNSYCRKCGLIQQTYSTETVDLPASNISVLTKDDVATYSRRKDNYDKPKQFRRYVESMIGIGQIVIPARYIRDIFPRYMEKMGLTSDDLNRQEIEIMLIRLGVYKILAADIPGIYYALTRKKYIDLSEKDVDNIVDFYTIAARDESCNTLGVPLHKFMFPRIMTHFGIPFDGKRVDYIKTEVKNIIVERRWRKIASNAISYFDGNDNIEDAPSLSESFSSSDLEDSYYFDSDSEETTDDSE